MIAGRSSVCLQRSRTVFKTIDAAAPLCVPKATVMKLKKPPNYDHVVMPERTRLFMYAKVPQPLQPSVPHQKMSKKLWLMRGPEDIHNKIIYGEYGIQAVSGGRMKYNHFESIRLVIIRKMNDKKMFAEWRVDAPWQPVSKKGLGHRMGGGKASIDRFESPVKPERIIIEVGGYCEYEEVERFLWTITKFLPFKSRIVSRASLEAEAREEEVKDKLNQNPFTFEYAAKNNLTGIDTFLSPYDKIFNGKYR